MELTKAIEILIIHNDHNPAFTDAEREEAHQLGIEAIKCIKRLRKYEYFGYPTNLPSETPPK